VGVIDKRAEQLDFARRSQVVAVIRYHRALVLDSLGQQAEAEKDRQRVVDLGFEPGDHLF
jgi:hypothetical protein